MTSRELIRKLRRLGAVVHPSHGKGGHVGVELNGHSAVVPTGSGEIKTGTLHGILKTLGLGRDDLR